MMDDCNFTTTSGVDGQQVADSICQGDNFAIVIDDLVVSNTCSI
jgi:hypothetical protein